MKGDRKLSYEITNENLLKYAIENGIIDPDTIRQKIAMSERKKYLDSHIYEIWQGKDGKFYTYLPDEIKGRKLLKRVTKQNLEDAIIDCYKKMEKEPYVKTIFNLWIESKIKYGEIQKQTSQRYERDYERFIKGTPFETTKIKFVTEDMLEDFIKSTIYMFDLTAKAWSGLRTILYGMFKYAKKKKYTNISISQFFGDLDLSSKAFKQIHKRYDELVFTKEEQKLIENRLKEKKPSILGYGVMLAFQTGLRCGELSTIKWSDIEGNTLDINRTEISYYKGKDYIYEVRDYPKTPAAIRNVILTPKAQNILKEIRKINPFGEYIFMCDGERVKGKAFSGKLRRTCDELGITRRSLHKARMTYATNLIDAQVPESLIINQMGHTDIETTKQFYYKYNISGNNAEILINSALNCEK